jgi:TRAP-type C4-dicarboxylate transport system permease small subunit
MSLKIVELNVISPSMTWLNMGYVFLLLPVAAVFSLLAVVEAACNIVFPAKKEEK